LWWKEPWRFELQKWLIKGWFEMLDWGVNRNRKLIWSCAGVLTLAIILSFGAGVATGNSEAIAATGAMAVSPRSAAELSPRETEIETRFGAQDKAQTQESGAISILSSAGAFAFVLCLAALATLLVSYFMKYRRLPILGKKRELPHTRVRVLESIPLGQRRFLTLVEAGGEVHMLGMTPVQVNYLAKLSGNSVSEAAEEPRPKPAAKRATHPPSLIQQLAGEGSNGVSAGNFEEQYKQLRAMLGGK
jgi:flagellar biogenesis protein FliO